MFVEHCISQDYTLRNIRARDCDFCDLRVFGVSCFYVRVWRDFLSKFKSYLVESKVKNIRLIDFGIGCPGGLGCPGGFNAVAP